MQTEATTTIRILSAADVEGLIEQLPTLAHERVVVSVLDDSDALLTAAEFSKVLAAARSHNVSLAISTDDRLRCELARMLGWSVVPPTPEQEDLAGRHRKKASQDDVTEEVLHDDRRGNTTVDLASYVPIKVQIDDTDESADSSELRTDTTIVMGTEVTKPVGIQAGARETPHRHPNARDEEKRANASKVAAMPRSERTSRRRRRGLLVGAIAAPLLVLAVVAGLLVYVLPTVTITLVPIQQPIAASLSYGVALPGTSHDISIEPSVMTHSSSFERTIPTTGERFEPDASATGTVMFTNPLTRVVTVPAGTSMTGNNGVRYTTTNDIAVPAADPFGSLSFGSGSVTVRAGISGPEGNLDPGTIVGQLDAGVFYNNREAITGGTMKRIAVISTADIEALRIAAEEDLNSRTEPEFLSTIPGSMTLIPDSTSFGQAVLTFSNPARTDGTEVWVKGTREASGQVFDPAPLHAQAREEAGRRLAMQAGPDVILLGDSVRIDDPTPLNDGTAFEIHAEATVRSVITDEERDEIAAQLVGKDLSDSQNVLSGLNDVSQFQIDLQPSWLPDRLPELISRIQVEVANELPEDGI